MRLTITTKNHDFSKALKDVKKGNRISRSKWNNPNVFVVYQKGYPEGISCNKQTAEAWGLNEGDKFICNPYLQIQNSDGSHSMWVPSIDDILADDWMVSMTASNKVSAYTE